MTLTKPMADEYARLFRTCIITPARATEVRNVVRSIVRGRDKYEAVSAATQIPWFVIGILHMLEASGSFSKHLHNGDPLTVRTTHVPKNRPKTGSPPFTWVESAIDALREVETDSWSLTSTLYTFEDYNGWGYRKRKINSPYLWAASNQYTRGKFVADGVWSATAVSKQVGAAVLLKMLMADGIVQEMLV